MTTNASPSSKTFEDLSQSYEKDKLKTLCLTSIKLALRIFQKSQSHPIFRRS